MSFETNNVTLKTTGAQKVRKQENEAIKKDSTIKLKGPDGEIKITTTGEKGYEDAIKKAKEKDGMYEITFTKTLEGKEYLVTGIVKTKNGEITSSGNNSDKNISNISRNDKGLDAKGNGKVRFEMDIEGEENRSCGKITLKTANKLTDPPFTDKEIALIKAAYEKDPTGYAIEFEYTNGTPKLKTKDPAPDKPIPRKDDDDKNNEFPTDRYKENTAIIDDKKNNKVTDDKGNSDPDKTKSGKARDEGKAKNADKDNKITKEEKTETADDKKKREDTNTWNAMKEYNAQLGYKKSGNGYSAGLSRNEGESWDKAIDKHLNNLERTVQDPVTRVKKDIKLTPDEKKILKKMFLDMIAAKQDLQKKTSVDILTVSNKDKTNITFIDSNHEIIVGYQGKPSPETNTYEIAGINMPKSTGDYFADKTTAK